MSALPATQLSATEPAVEAAARLRFVITRIHRLLRQHSDGDLTLTQTSALATVNRRGPLTLGALAAAEQVSPPTITKVVGHLEAHGFVSRAVDAADRRVARLTITEDGEAHLADLRQQRTAWMATRLADLTPADLHRLTDALDILERLAAEPPHAELQHREPTP